MLLIAGLGNPGPKYARHRHNVGFMALERIAEAHGFAPWRRRFQGEAADGVLGTEKALLLKPQTFMNESGRAVGEAARFFKLEGDDVVVIHDEVDLAPGKLRVKTGGGEAGHNGLRSISASPLGKGYRRMRVGVGHPGRKEAVPGYVLHDFAKADADWLEPLLDAIAEAAPLLALRDDPRVMTEIARRVQAEAAPARPAKRVATKPGKPGKAAEEASAAPAQGPFATLRRLLGG